MQPFGLPNFRDLGARNRIEASRAPHSVGFPHHHPPNHPPFPRQHRQSPLSDAKCRNQKLPPLSSLSSSSSSAPVKRVPVRLSVLPSVVRVSRRWISARWVGESRPWRSCRQHRTDARPLLQEFNARTAHITTGTPMPCRVTVRGDRSFHFDVRTPQTSWLLRNAAELPVGKGGVRKGASKPGHETVGTVSLKHIYEIAKIKQSELRLSGLPLEGICKSVIHQAKSIGIAVVP